MIYDITGKACHSCGGVAKAAVLLISEKANARLEQVEGHALCLDCFERVRESTDQVNGVIFLDDVSWSG